VISSTVGLEALLHEKPVLTLGQPFYAGYGITLDVDSFAQLREAVPALLEFRPDPERIRRFLHAAMRACYPGAPVLVDRSEENALALADSIERRAREAVAERAPMPA
jgi:capsular polysaccharide biosynthesis protein